MQTSGQEVLGYTGMPKM